MKNTALVVALLAAVSLSACVSMKSYPDPTLRTVTLKDLKAQPSPQPVQVLAEFRRDGEIKTESSARLKSRVERSLATTGVFRADDASPLRLRVSVSNAKDRDQSMGTGVRAGLTFGLVGGEVTDRYEFNFALSNAQGAVTKDVFLRHALKSLVGQVDAPLGVTPEDPAIAFDKVVQDMVYAFVKQYQDSQAQKTALQP